MNCRCAALCPPLELGMQPDSPETKNRARAGPINRDPARQALRGGTRKWREPPTGTERLAIQNARSSHSVAQTSVFRQRNLDPSCTRLQRARKDNKTVAAAAGRDRVFWLQAEETPLVVVDLQGPRSSQAQRLHSISQPSPSRLFIEWRQGPRLPQRLKMSRRTRF